MENKNGQNLINLLKNNSTRFLQINGGYELLQEFFNGFPVENVEFLLDHTESRIISEGLWIISELGENLCEKYLSKSIRLLNNTDDVIQSFALECIFLGTRRNKSSDFVFFLRGLEINSETVKMNAILLLSKTLRSQIDAINENSLHELGLDKHHLIGLSYLKEDRIGEIEIKNLLSSNIELLRLYGMAIAIKHLETFPNILNAFPVKIDTVAKKMKKILEKYP